MCPCTCKCTCMTYELVFLKIICTVYFNRTVSLSAVSQCHCLNQQSAIQMCLIYAQIFPTLTVVAESAIRVKQSKLPPGIAPPEKIIRGPQGHQFYNCHILHPSCIVTGPHQSMKLMIDDNRCQLID